MMKIHRNQTQTALRVAKGCSTVHRKNLYIFVLGVPWRSCVLSVSLDVWQRLFIDSPARRRRLVEIRVRWRARCDCSELKGFSRLQTFLPPQNHHLLKFTTPLSLPFPLLFIISSISSYISVLLNRVLPCYVAAQTHEIHYKSLASLRPAPTAASRCLRAPMPKVRCVPHAKDHESAVGPEAYEKIAITYSSNSFQNFPSESITPPSESITPLSPQHSGYKSESETAEFPFLYDTSQLETAGDGLTYYPSFKAVNPASFTLLGSGRIGVIEGYKASAREMRAYDEATLVRASILGQGLVFWDSVVKFTDSDRESSTQYCRAFVALVLEGYRPDPVVHLGPSQGSQYNAVGSPVKWYLADTKHCISKNPGILVCCRKWGAEQLVWVAGVRLRVIGSGKGFFRVGDKIVCMRNVLIAPEMTQENIVSRSCLYDRGFYMEKRKMMMGSRVVGSFERDGNGHYASGLGRVKELMTGEISPDYVV